MWEKLINTGGAQLGFNLFNHETSCPFGAEGVRLLHLHELFPGCSAVSGVSAGQDGRQMTFRKYSSTCAESSRC